MKRLSVFVALAVVLTVMSCGVTHRSQLTLSERQNWDGAKLNGNISQIVENSYELAGSYGRTVKTELISQKLIEFNERGDLIASVEYDIDSLLIERKEYQYDDRGYTIYDASQGDGYKFANRYTRDEYGYVVDRDLLKGDGSLDIRYAYKYDGFGNLEETILYDAQGDVESGIVTSYDDSNRPAEVLRYTRHGQLQRRETFIYAANGNLSEHLIYDEYDNLDGRHVYTYGINGRDEECTSYDGNGMFESRVSQRYDENDNLVEYTTYDADGAVIERKSCTYDSLNHIVEEYRTTNDTVLSICKYVYDDKGLLIEYIDDDKFHGQFSVVTYRYDDMGNVVEEVGYSGERRIAQYVVEYAITYRE